MLLQQCGRRTLVIDRTRHPRFAIGESTTPIANILVGLIDSGDVELLPPEDGAEMLALYRGLGEEERARLTKMARNLVATMPAPKENPHEDLA